MLETTKIGGGSANSYIDGTVRRQGANVLVFPIGNRNNANRYAPIVIDNLGIVSEFTATYIAMGYGNTTVDVPTVTTFPFYSLSPLEHWVINKTLGAAVPNIKFYHQGTGSNLPTPANGRIAHFNATTFWGDLGADGIGNDALGNFIVKNGIINFSPFTLATTNTVILPVSIYNFNASKTSNLANSINWKVGCNAQSANFDLLRSTNGTTFTSVYTLNATQLRCNEPFNYIDNFLATSPVTYYKLKTASNTGETDISQIIKINNDKAVAVLTILPSLITNSATIIVNSMGTNNTNFIITNTKGVIINTFAKQLMEGNNFVNINLQYLAKGTYQLTAFINKKAVTVKFIKQ